MTSTAIGRIVEEYSEGENRIALVEFDGKRRAVYLSLVPHARVGDCVRFHAGFATEKVEGGEGEGGCGKSGKSKETTVESHADLSVESSHAYRLLSDLGPEQLRKLLPLAQEKQFNEGEVIFHFGDRSSFLHLIVSGEVALNEVSAIHPVTVQKLQAGDAIGWSALTPGAHTHFEARAISHVTTVAFSGDQLREACDLDPAMGYALIKRLLELVTERLDAVRARLAQLPQSAS